MESMSAAKAAVKYSVVNQVNEEGLFKAMTEQMTVHNGNKVVAMSAVLT